MEALRKNGIQPLFGRGFHDSTQTVPHRDRYEMNAAERRKYAPQID